MKKGRILIAEDDPDVAQTLAEGLHSFDFEVVATVAYGEHIVNAVNIHDPDLMIVDIFLEGDLDGISATKPLVQEYHPPIIFLTGNFTIELVSRLKEHRNAMLLYKPYKIPELIANIEIALVRQKQGQEAFTSLFSSMSSMQTDEFRRQLGQVIKAARKEFNLTQANAAEKFSINYRYFQDIEAGKANLKIDTLFKIIKGLNLDNFEN